MALAFLRGSVLCIGGRLCVIVLLMVCVGGLRSRTAATARPPSHLSTPRLLAERLVLNNWRSTDRDERWG